MKECQSFTFVVPGFSDFEFFVFEQKEVFIAANKDVPLLYFFSEPFQLFVQYFDLGFEVIGTLFYFHLSFIEIDLVQHRMFQIGPEHCSPFKLFEIGLLDFD